MYAELPFESDMSGNVFIKICIHMSNFSFELSVYKPYKFVLLFFVIAFVILCYRFFLLLLFSYVYVFFIFLGCEFSI